MKIFTKLFGKKKKKIEMESRDEMRRRTMTRASIQKRRRSVSRDDDFADGVLTGAIAVDMLSADEDYASSSRQDHCSPSPYQPSSESSPSSSYNSSPGYDSSPSDSGGGCD